MPRWILEKLNMRVTYGGEQKTHHLQKKCRTKEKEFKKLSKTKQGQNGIGGRQICRQVKECIEYKKICKRRKARVQGIISNRVEEKWQ